MKLVNPQVELKPGNLYQQSAVHTHTKKGTLLTCLCMYVKYASLCMLVFGVPAYGMLAYMPAYVCLLICACVRAQWKISYLSGYI